MLHIILFFSPLSIVSATNIWPVKFSSMNKLNKIATRFMRFYLFIFSFFSLSLGDPHASAKDFGWCEKEKVRHESNKNNRDWFHIITTACSEPVVLAEYHSLLNLIDGTIRKIWRWLLKSKEFQITCTSLTLPKIRWIGGHVHELLQIKVQNVNCVITL